MMAFAVKMPLSLLKPTSAPTPTPATAVTSIEKRVRWQQAKMKEQHDSRTRAKPPTIKAGDYVRIRLPTQQHKLAMAYSDPFQVKRVAGNTVWLSNGKRWNLRRCLPHKSAVKVKSSAISEPLATVPAPSPAVDEDEDEAEGPTFDFTVGPTTNNNMNANRPEPPVGPRRSTRQRKQRDFSPFIRY
jgi:hypothetical protein